MTDSRRTTATIALTLAVVLTPAALFPIRSYDFFWHLATGRWIAEHGTLPIMDPFAVASDRVPWINGEWLFQLVIHYLGSVTAISWAKAAGVAAMFAGVFAASSRRSSPALSLLLTSAAFAGGLERLDARPSTAAAALLVAGLALLDSNRRDADIAFVALAAVWINVHPSALLAPAIAFACRRIHWLPLASAGALLLNPFGLRGILAPLELTALARSGAFVNAEWLPSPPMMFPLLYGSVLAGLVLFASARKESGRFVVFAGLSYLAIAHVRNQGIYFAAFPLLLAPWASAHQPVTDTIERRRSLVCAASAAAFVIAAAGVGHGSGFDSRRFPAAAVSRLMGAGLRGNIYNPDQFGGFLIWTTYPARRTLTDGRNELYRTYIAEYARARQDSRAWQALLRRYRIDLAVDEYRPLLDTVNPGTGEHRAVPASLAYWPRRDWALVAYDDAAMIFARRAAFPPGALDRLELKGIVPDAPRE